MVFASTPFGKASGGRLFAGTAPTGAMGVLPMKLKHAVRSALAAAGLFALVGVARAQTTNTVTPPEVLADQLRSQGYPCDRVLGAEQDVEASRRDVSVWVLRCTNGSYRMRLVPDVAAKVERID